MPNPIIRIHDIESGEVIDRPMTKEEFADHQASIAALENEKIATADSRALKIAGYEKLGLTADEIAAILG